MKKYLLSVMSLLSIGMAQAAETSNDAIYVWSSESEYTCYLLSGTPTITYDDNTLVISVNGGEAKRIPLSQVSDVEVTYGIKYPSVTLNSKGYATLSFKADMQLTSDCMKAYTAHVSGGQIICTEVADGIIPAGNGVLVYGTPSATTQLVAATSTSALSSDNDLKATTLADGSLAAVPATGYTYVLSGSTFGLYTGTTFTADKAYFNLTSRPTASSNAKMSIIFNDSSHDATGIDALGDAKVPSVVYDLQGRKVTNPSNGIYIINNKKVVIK